MKRLYLLRHAKSDWSNMGLVDHDRILNRRGQKAAALIGQRFKDFGREPDLVVCSTALRARETLDRLMAAGSYNWNVQNEKRLYGASPDTILSIVHQYGASCDTLMLVGHNPGMADVAKALAGDAKPGLLERLISKVPTGAMITLEFDIPSFQGVRAKSGMLTQFLRPKHELA
ncbi:SixA phosphatase family protein [Kordiimonas pumila]|uniref:SixA phosphatase family protein n=1 Tax=Kordiimonas pumila TaxID=2161677 RepID=A0ABV7D5P1_9PROT|nr:histidine phosphatase family protein [Kordiimonas pumila]